MSESCVQVRKKVMELLIHVNKRMKCRAEVQLPVQTLLQLYADATSNSFIIVSVLFDYYHYSVSQFVPCH